MTLFTTLLLTKSVSASELSSHDSIWTSGFTMPKEQIAVEVSGQWVQFDYDFNDQPNTLTADTWVQIPNLHVRYGILNGTEIFANANHIRTKTKFSDNNEYSYSKTFMTTGLKQQIFRLERIPIGVQTRVAYQHQLEENRMGQHHQILAGFGGELAYPFLHSSIEVFGQGANFGSETQMNYALFVQTGHQIPVYTSDEDTTIDFVFEYTQPIETRSYALERDISSQRSNTAEPTLGGVNYLLYASLHAGLQVDLNDSFSIYALFATQPGIGMVSESDTKDANTYTLQPWAQTDTNINIAKNGGLRVTVSSVF